MSATSVALRSVLPALGAALPAAILFFTVLSIPLAAAPDLQLSTKQINGWIMVLYGLPGVLSLGLAFHYRQPIILTGNVFAIIFVASLGDQLAYSEIIGASLVAGVVVFLVTVLGLTERLAGWLPLPIVMGLLAGAVMPYIAGIFTALGEEPALVGGAFLAYLVSRRAFGTRLPPVLPALIVGMAIAGVTGMLGPAPAQFGWPIPALTMPDFSLQAIVTATPVFVVLITLQSNLASVIVLQDQGYQPPERAINIVSGGGTLVGSLLGPTAISMPLPAVPLVAGSEAGGLAVRYRAAYVAASALILIALLSGVAAELATIIPRPLLLALAGMALVGVLAGALQQVTRGPLLLGPLFAFAIALSEISLLGLNPFFWSLTGGTVISLLIERDEWKSLQRDASK